MIDLRDQRHMSQIAVLEIERQGTRERLIRSQRPGDLILCIVRCPRAFRARGDRRWSGYGPVRVCSVSRLLDDVRDAMARGSVEVTAFSQDKRRTLGKGTLLLIAPA